MEKKQKEKIELNQYEIMTFGDILNYYEDETKKATIQDIYTRIGFYTIHIETLKDSIKNTEKRIKQNKNADTSYSEYCKFMIKSQETQLNKLKQLIKDLRTIYWSLMNIRQFSWEIAFGYLNNENVPEDEYIEKTLKNINTWQKDIEELANLDIDEYEYFYSCYKEIQDQLKATK